MSKNSKVINRFELNKCKVITELQNVISANNQIEVDDPFGIYEIKFIIYGDRKLIYQIYYLESYIDVLPVMTSFSNFEYNPYSAIEAILSPTGQSKSLKDIINILLSHFLDSQKYFLETNMHWLKNENISFILDILNSKSQLKTIIEKQNSSSSDLYSIIIEFPLFQNDETNSLFMKYSKHSKIYINLNIKFYNIINSSIQDISYNVNIPTTIYPCTSNIDLSKSKLNISNKIDSTNLFEIINKIELKIINEWLLRKKFIMEFFKLNVSIIEYDSIDYSFIMMSVRMKHNNMITLCSIEIKLIGSITTTKPLLSIHDLQNRFSIPVDQNRLNYSLSLNVEIMAKEILNTTMKIIHEQAYGETM